MGLVHGRLYHVEFMISRMRFGLLGTTHAPGEQAGCASNVYNVAMIRKQLYLEKAQDKALKKGARDNPFDAGFDRSQLS